MWRKIKDSEYFLSFSDDHDYEINVTDFISIWTVSYSKKDFITLLKDSNEGLILENDKHYIKNAFNLLSLYIGDLKQSRIEENGNSLKITMRMLLEFPFCVQCKFTKGSNELFFDKVTRPLLNTVKDLRSSQAEMRNLLLKKDKQVKAYERELENKKIIFRHEETKAYDDVEHMAKFKAYEETFGSTDIPKSLIEKFVKIPEILNKENPAVSSRSIKQEPTGISKMQNIIKQEVSSIKLEPNHIKEECNSIKEEPVSIKEEPCTPILEEPTPTMPIIAQTVSFKQEVVKTDTQSSQMRTDRRKKLKLNY